MAIQPPKRLSSTDAPAEALERVVRTRGVTAEPGDILVVRERPGRLAAMGRWRYAVKAEGCLDSTRHFAKYDAAVVEGERIAARQQLRLLYLEDGQSLLLMDYRQSNHK